MRLIAPMIFGWICLAGLAQEPSLEPLPGALWKGSIEFTVSGEQFTQSMNAVKTEDGRPEYVKEKGRMAVDLRVTIEFYIDAVGDTHALAQEHFKGDYLVTNSSHHQLKEAYLNRGLKDSRLVQITESRQTQVPFQATATRNQEQMIDNLRLTASGKLDGKGELEVSGDFVYSFDGSGSFEEQRTRQPALATDPNAKKVASVKKRYKLPVTFRFKTALAGKPIAGALTIQSDPKSPFPEGPPEVKPNYQSQISASGSYRLEPLFGKP